MDNFLFTFAIHSRLCVFPSPIVRENLRLEENCFQTPETAWSHAELFSLRLSTDKHEFEPEWTLLITKDINVAAATLSLFQSRAINPSRR